MKEIDSASLTQEEIRLNESDSREKNWQRWGPYLSERQWATVREDYSVDGSSWTYFPHDAARSRAYRWGEDGLLGMTDRECRLCFALALWNGKDPILKERLFGLTEREGNHAEDVKEYYYYLDSTPTHSYMKALYKYPQREYPYAKLVDENKKRGLNQSEYELLDSGVFDENRYFDVVVEYAKRSPDDILIRITIVNRGSEAAKLHLLPTLWFRNTWSWGCKHEGCTLKPFMRLQGERLVETSHETLGRFWFTYDVGSDGKNPSILFTENHTNDERLYGKKNPKPYVRDSFHDYIIHGVKSAINPANLGTKCAPHYILHIQPGGSEQIRLRLAAEGIDLASSFDQEFEETFAKRKQEADAFYEKKIPAILSSDEKNISRQAYGGLLWTKQFYHYVVKDWLEGDPYQPPPPPERATYGRNIDWLHFFARDVLSVPDKWEYPWFAAWDSAFHMIPFARIDPEFAKSQLLLFLREWYMHPNGQQAAYEFSFSDVNPPVHAWAAWRVYKMTGKKGSRDIQFLESVFQKLLLNFTWWVNRKDPDGHHVFSGGFLGLDNIGVFNRSVTLPYGAVLRQADGTAWMAFYCLTMLTMALELASYDIVYEDMASKFFEHFVAIADAINEFGGRGLWDDQDGFYYDQVKVNGQQIPLRTRSLVGLIPLIAVEILEDSHLEKLKGFSKRMNWFLKYRKDLAQIISYCKVSSDQGLRLLAIPSKKRLIHMLRYLLDESEFLSPYGIRSMSKIHEKNPYSFHAVGREFRVEYTPGESNSRLYGGNSNWRGPIWLPINFLLIEALERYAHFYGDDFKVECPVGSGKMMNLKEVAVEIVRRLSKIFMVDQEGKRPCHGNIKYYQTDPHWNNLLLFHEYFHAETGQGLGASHQTGWTALIAKLLEEKGL